MEPSSNRMREKSDPNLDAERNVLLKYLVQQINGSEHHAIRHHNKKHSRLIDQLLIKAKSSTQPPILKTTQAQDTREVDKISSNITQPIQNNTVVPSFVESNNNIDSTCYSTNQVLCIIGLTCFLNFAFIALVFVITRCFGGNRDKSNRSDKDTLINENNDDYEDDDDEEYEESEENGRNLSSWESSRLRLASLPDNIITQNLTERYMASKLATQDNSIFNKTENYNAGPIGYSPFERPRDYPSLNKPCFPYKRRVLDYDQTVIESEDDTYVNKGAVRNFIRKKRQNYSRLPTGELIFYTSRRK